MQNKDNAQWNIAMYLHNVWLAQHVAYVDPWRRSEEPCDGDERTACLRSHQGAHSDLQVCQGKGEYEYGLKLGRGVWSNAFSTSRWPEGRDSAQGAAVGLVPVSHVESRRIRRVARRLLRMLIGSGSSLNKVFLGVLSIIPASFWNGKQTTDISSSIQPSI